ncbi:MAG: PQQ-binding-like beta-propeller repeat protein [Pirellulales bacterium]
MTAKDVRRFSLAMALFAASAASVSAQEWTRFRGPNGTGESDAATVPSKWTDADYNWKIELPGEGHSAPVLWGKKLFITSSDPKTATQVVMCYDAATGKQSWKKDFPSTSYHLHKLNTFASSTPAVDADAIYFVRADATDITLVALDHGGEQLWKKDLGPFVSQHGYGTSPIVYEDLVVLGNDQGIEPSPGESFLIALDRKTGEQRWRTPRKSREAAYSTPCVYQPANGQPELVFNSGAEGMTSIDPKSGKVNWQIDLFDKRSCSSPVIVGDIIYGSCGSGAGGGNYVVAVRAPNGKDRTAPEIAYKMTRAAYAPYVPGFVAKGDLVFLWSDKGFVSCLRAATGEALWQQRVGGTFYGSPIRVGDNIYCQEASGELVVVAAAEKYKLVARVPLGEPTNSTPAIADGTMYLRTTSHLMSLGGAKK